jgi:SAM-dependent methyltransferase
MNTTLNEQQTEVQPGKNQFAGIFLISLGAMVVEIAFTRVFSFLLFYHYAFLVIGLAMLGLAIGGLLTWKREGGVQPASRRPLLWGSLAGVATAVTTLLIVLGASFEGVVVFTALAALSFVLVGATTATLLSRFPSSAGQIYAADLAGAAIGTIVSIALLSLLGAVDALLVTAAIIGWGGWLLEPRGSRVAALSAMAAGALTLLSIANGVTGVVDLDVRAMQSGKPMTDLLGSAGQVVFSRWDAFARTDVVAPQDRNDLKYVFIDGGAGAAMFQADEELSSSVPLTRDIGFFPFHSGPAGEVLAIGPGGGRDVLLSLMGGATRVTAVEVNPGTVEAVRRFSAFNGSIYNRKDVEVVVDEGRSYLKRTAKQYDTIYLSLAMTQTAERSGYALAENYLYTVEAMKDYLDHLKPGGQLVFKLHESWDLERTIRTAMQTLEEEGIPNDHLSQHMMAVAEPMAHAAHESSLMYPLLMIRRDGYTPDQVQHHLAAADELSYQLLYLPGVGGLGPLAGVQASGEQTPKAGLSGFEDNSPTVDDRPFFYLNSKIPPMPALILLAVACLLGMATMRRLPKSTPEQVVPLRLSLTYFAALGLAFMLVEVVLIQKLTLFLGHPTIAITTVLFSLLVSSAVGSYLSARGRGHMNLPAASALAAGILVLAYTQLIPMVEARFFSSSTPERVLVAVLLVAPIGTLMGIPFPGGLRSLSRQTPALLPPLAWAANGFASVFGSASGIIIAVVFGFNSTLLVGGVAYLAAGALAAWAERAMSRRSRLEAARTAVNAVGRATGIG